MAQPVPGFDGRCWTGERAGSRPSSPSGGKGLRGGHEWGLTDGQEFDSQRQGEGTPGGRQEVLCPTPSKRGAGRWPRLLVGGAPRCPAEVLEGGGPAIQVHPPASLPIPRLSLALRAPPTPPHQTPPSCSPSAARTPAQELSHEEHRLVSE